MKIKTYPIVFIATFAFYACSYCNISENSVLGDNKTTNYTSDENDNSPQNNQNKQIQDTETKANDTSERNLSDYNIRAKDVLYITVYDEPDLSYDRQNQRSLRVSVEGMISFPLVGDIKVAGLTPFQLQKKLEQLLSEGYLINPHVSVIVGEYPLADSIYIYGQVKNPGSVKLLEKDITIIEAISLAGGFTPIASPGRARIVRMENGEEKTIYVNIEKIMKGKKSKDIKLKPGDIVVVPESLF